jgi:hypothetical protein
MVIGQFLPVEMVYKLYSVNSTFFQLYLSLKYRTIRMEFLDNDEIEEKTVAWFAHLRKAFPYSQLVCN